MAENLMVGGYQYQLGNVIHEQVIYCGCFIKQWGHFLVDFMPRLWYLLEHDGGQPLVYLSRNQARIDGCYKELLNLFGVQSSRLVYIDTPTRFDSVIVPQTSFMRPNSYYREFRQIFRHIVENLEKENLQYTNYDRIYWTRTKFKKARKTEMGEERIEKLFQKNGFKVLAPERMSVREQVFYFSRCKYMAGVSGTIPHNLVFCGAGTRFVVINRTYRINTIQLPINEMNGANVVYVDCHASFFPNSPDKGPYLLVYNDNLEKFAIDNGFIIPADVQKSKGRIQRRDFLKYCVRYFNIYNGLEFVNADSGMAGSILGRSRPSGEGVMDHEIYYYYRKRFRNVNDLNIMSKMKKVVKQPTNKKSS